MAVKVETLLRLQLWLDRAQYIDVDDVSHVLVSHDVSHVLSYVSHEVSRVLGVGLGSGRSVQKPRGDITRLGDVVRRDGVVREPWEQSQFYCWKNLYKIMK